MAGLGAFLYLAASFSNPGRHLGNTLAILHVIQNIIGQFTAMHAGLWQL